MYKSVHRLPNHRHRKSLNRIQNDDDTRSQAFYSFLEDTINTANTNNDGNITQRKLNRQQRTISNSNRFNDKQNRNQNKSIKNQQKCSIQTSDIQKSGRIKQKANKNKENMNMSHNKQNIKYNKKQNGKNRSLNNSDSSKTMKSCLLQKYNKNKSSNLSSITSQIPNKSITANNNIKNQTKYTQNKITTGKNIRNTLNTSQKSIAHNKSLISQKSCNSNSINPSKSNKYKRSSTNKLQPFMSHQNKNVTSHKVNHNKSMSTKVKLSATRGSLHTFAQAKQLTNSQTLNKTCNSKTSLNTTARKLEISNNTVSLKIENHLPSQKNIKSKKRTNNSKDIIDNQKLLQQLLYGQSDYLCSRHIMTQPNYNQQSSQQMLLQDITHQEQSLQQINKDNIYTSLQPHHLNHQKYTSYQPFMNPTQTILQNIQFHRSVNEVLQSQQQIRQLLLIQKHQDDRFKLLMRQSAITHNLLQGAQSEQKMLVYIGLQDSPLFQRILADFEQNPIHIIHLYNSLCCPTRYDALRQYMFNHEIYFNKEQLVNFDEKIKKLCGLLRLNLLNRIECGYLLEMLLFTDSINNEQYQKNSQKWIAGHDAIMMNLLFFQNQKIQSDEQKSVWEIILAIQKQSSINFLYQSTPPSAYSHLQSSNTSRYSVESITQQNTCAVKTKQYKSVLTSITQWMSKLLPNHHF